MIRSARSCTLTWQHSSPSSCCRRNLSLYRELDGTVESKNKLALAVEFPETCVYTTPPTHQLLSNCLELVNTMLQRTAYSRRRRGDTRLFSVTAIHHLDRHSGRHACQPFSFRFYEYTYFCSIPVRGRSGSTSPPDCPGLQSHCRHDPWLRPLAASTPRDNGHTTLTKHKQ